MFKIFQYLWDKTFPTPTHETIESQVLTAAKRDLVQAKANEEYWRHVSMMLDFRIKRIEGSENATEQS